MIIPTMESFTALAAPRSVSTPALTESYRPELHPAVAHPHICLPLPSDDDSDSTDTTALSLSCVQQSRFTLGARPGTLTAGLLLVSLEEGEAGVQVPGVRGVRPMETSQGWVYILDELPLVLEVGGDDPEDGWFDPGIRTVGEQLSQEGGMADRTWSPTAWEGYRPTSRTATFPAPGMNISLFHILMPPHSSSLPESIYPILSQPTGLRHGMWLYPSSHPRTHSQSSLVTAAWDVLPAVQYFNSHHPPGDGYSHLLSLEHLHPRPTPTSSSPSSSSSSGCQWVRVAVYMKELQWHGAYQRFKLWMNHPALQALHSRQTQGSAARECVQLWVLTGDPCAAPGWEDRGSNGTESECLLVLRYLHANQVLIQYTPYLLPAHSSSFSQAPPPPLCTWLLTVHTLILVNSYGDPASDRLMALSRLVKQQQLQQQAGSIPAAEGSDSPSAGQWQSPGRLRVLLDLPNIPVPGHWVEYIDAVLVSICVRMLFQ